MKKRVAILLVVFILFGCITAYAYNVPKVEDVKESEKKIEVLKEKGILIGYEDGSLGLDKNIKRSELTKVLVHGVGEEKTAEELKGKSELFTDVAKDYWANGYIAFAKDNPNPINKVPFVNGYPDGSFKPENNITNAEMVKILVVLAKRDLTEEMVKKAKWPGDWVEWAKDEKVIGEEVGIKDLELDKPATREDSFVALYNAFVQLGKTGPLEEDDVKAVKDEVQKFIDSIDMETIEKVASEVGSPAHKIPGKEDGLKAIKEKVDRAKELIAKDELTAEELEELKELKPVKHEKKDKLIKGLAEAISHGIVVDWEVQGDRTVSNKDGSKKYTELTDNKIVVKSVANKLEDGAYDAYINLVKKEQYEAEDGIDTVTGATPKYKKEKLDAKFFTVEKTEDGFVFKMNTDAEGYDDMIKDAKILKPIIKVPVADRVKIENGDLVFVK